MDDMEAVVLNEDSSLSVERTSIPEPGPTEVRVEVGACGISRTVENGIQGSLSGSGALVPRIPGQEFAGVVDAVGGNVTAVSEGERVVGYVYVTCGECEHCLAGDSSRCVDMDGKVGVTRDGGYAEYVTLPAENALPLPAEASVIEGVVAADAVATPLHACRRADVDEDDTVLVIGGAGRIGVHTAAVARLRGAEVIAAETSDDRIAYVEDTLDGVDAVDATADDLAERIRSLTRRRDGPTVVMDTTGHMPTLRDAWDAMVMGGRFVSFTTDHEHVFDVDLREFVVIEGSLLGTRYASRAEVVRAAHLLADGRIDAIHRGTVTLEEVPSVHRRIRTDRTHGLTIVEP